MIQLLVFDADGVLFDSYESNLAYYNAIFARMGEPPLDAEERAASVAYAAGQLFELRAGGDRTRLARMHEISRNLDSTPFFTLLRPSLELRPFLLGLKPRYRLALATNRSATVPALVNYLKLGDVFDVIASARDKVPPKPAPDILLLCLERAGVAPRHAVYVGDSPGDREAALAAGMKFIAVGPRVDHPQRIGKLDELVDLLERIAPAPRQGDSGA